MDSLTDEIRLDASLNEKPERNIKVVYTKDGEERTPSRLELIRKKKLKKISFVKLNDK